MSYNNTIDDNISTTLLMSPWFGILGDEEEVFRANSCVCLVCSFMCN